MASVEIQGRSLSARRCFSLVEQSLQVLFLVKSVIVDGMAVFDDSPGASPIAECVRGDAQILCGLLDSKITIKFFHNHNPEAGNVSEAHLATFANLTSLRGEVQTHQSDFGKKRNSRAPHNSRRMTIRRHYGRFSAEKGAVSER